MQQVNMRPQKTPSSTTPTFSVSSCTTCAPECVPKHAPNDTKAGSDALTNTIARSQLNPHSHHQQAPAFLGSCRPPRLSRIVWPRSQSASCWTAGAWLMMTQSLPTRKLVLYWWHSGCPGMGADTGCVVIEFKYCSLGGYMEGRVPS